jgi:Trypsin-like peptidase domain
LVKRVLWAVLWSFLALTSNSRAQTIDELKKCVGFVFGRVHIKGADGQMAKDEHGVPIILEMPLGTAFFVLYPDKRGGDNYGFVYVVTAKHVLKDVDDTYLKSVKVRLNLKEPESNTDVGFGEIPVADGDGKLLWFDDHDDSQNDVAVFPLLPDTNKVDFKAVSVDMFADLDLMRRENVTEGDSVYLFGLMPQYYGEKKNYPVVRKGSLALLTEEAIKTGPNTRQHAYLAEMGSWPGNSGAPVFLNLGGFRNNGIQVGSSFRLLGLMLGFFSNMRQAEIVDTRTVVGGDPSNIGISLSFPLRPFAKSWTLWHYKDSEIQTSVTGRKSARWSRVSLVLIASIFIHAFGMWHRASAFTSFASASAGLTRGPFRYSKFHLAAIPLLTTRGRAIIISEQ